MKRKIFAFVCLLVFLSVGDKVMAEEILSVRQQAIVEVSGYASLGNQEELKSALNRAFDAGVTLNELKEILVQSYAYCGFPRSLNALGSLMEVWNERGQNVEQGELPSKRLQNNSLEIGTINQTKLVGAPVKGALFDFAPAIDEFLKAHLFGDIFSRDNVDWSTRELATVSMLAVRSGVESQLNSHIEIAKRNGLSEAQISEVLNLAKAMVAKNVLFGFGEENTAYAQYFIGKSYLQKITTENGVPMFNVTFEPRCRNNWHIHHKGGQILLVTSGRGWYQEWGKPARELKPGDVVNIAPETKHWHGAAKDSWFTHIAVEVPSVDGSNEWLEAVSDEEYDKLP